jgi:NADH-quinone oxidoreductase subunit F
VKIFNRIADGGGRPEDAQLILDLVDNIEGKSFCALGDAAAWAIQGAIKRFPEDFMPYLNGEKTTSIEPKAKTV